MVKEYVPDKFKPLINISIENGVQNVEWTSPSGQLWQNYSEKEKAELAVLLESVGLDLKPLVDELRKVSPAAKPL